MDKSVTKRYTDAQLEENYNRFIEALKTAFSGDRLDKLLHMYSMDELGPNLLLSPASLGKHYHNCYEGGYIDHVVNVARNSLKMMQLYSNSGGTIDFTQEELLFAAFHHDLGKLGMKGSMHYIPNDSKWHVENKGQFYKSNDAENSYMDVTDRSFYLLSQYGISYSENEYFGIRLADGMYRDNNVQYLKTYDMDKLLRSNLPLIIHWADHMSTIIERDHRRKELNDV